MKEESGEFMVSQNNEYEQCPVSKYNIIIFKKCVNNNIFKIKIIIQGKVKYY